ncbi:MAG TPA: DUF4389 domain-containing protein [Gaiella sp.]|nr:DUF4389 domain-containing protein [Gaiella sp.]
MSAARTYPVHVEGTLDPHLSRWLWLVKWLLAIPHYIVLAFLWAAFVLLGVVAFFAILFTGRYPRAIFDFNVGVLRWTWRVGFYTFGALGTDRYPPFTLDDVPDYPARLDVDYPARLSRGLVLVKWWLLAIPQYVVVSVIAGGGGWLAWRGEHWSWSWGGGLIGLLVFFAGVALLFTARYPHGLFDLVVGLDRWAFRVVGYAALMTDAYPPFRLDQGGADPGGPETETLAVTEGGTPTAGGPGGTARRWSGGRIALLAVGSVLGLVSLGVIAAGAGALAIDWTQREDGFVTSPRHAYSTPTYALVSETADLDGPDWAWNDLVGTVRIQGRSGDPVFLGIGPDAEVERYLADVGHEVVHDIGHSRGDDDDRRQGGAPATPPGDQTFWAASAQGTGRVNLDWKPENGRWAVVVMNADGSRFVDATLSIGAELDALPWVGAALLGAGLLLALVAAGVIYASLPKRHTAIQDGGATRSSP